MDAVLASVAELLRREYGLPVRPTVSDRLRPHVLRVATGIEDGGLPASVIVRLGPERVEGGASPPGIGWGAVFANEWAGAAFLNRLQDVASAVPDLIAADLPTQILVTEDLGDGPGLDALLTGDDEAAAVTALVDHARLLGRIAAASHDRTDEYLVLRARAGPVTAASMLDDLRTGELRGPLQRFQDELGVDAPQGLDRELRRLDDEAAEPGTWVAYSPADACPDNNVVVDGQVRIFDLGFGGVRHVALDAVYGLIPFPTCWCYAPLPQAVSERMLAAFRSALASAVPEAREDEVWEAKLAWACGIWFSGFLATVTARELDRDQRRGPLSAREAAVAQLCAVASGTQRHYPAVSELATTLEDRLRERWAVGEVPTYPALRSSRASR